GAGVRGTGELRGFRVENEAPDESDRHAQDDGEKEALIRVFQHVTRPGSSPERFGRAPGPDRRVTRGGSAAACGRRAMCRGSDRAAQSTRPRTGSSSDGSGRPEGAPVK